MPKKVITRRQRKAAEAKRQSESNARATAASEAQNGTAAATTPSTSDAVKPGGSNGAKQDPKCGNKNASLKTTNTKTAVPQQGQEAENMPEQSAEKATGTVVVKDKTTQSDNNVFDLLADENLQKQVGHSAECQAQLPAPPANEQAGSFSKTLTRRAVATFSKIQKLSKVFNKKMNYKTPPVKGTEPMNLANVELDETVKTALNGPPGSDNQANKTCSCEFCKVVLNQLLAGKKRTNDKKLCKNANRRPPANAARATSPGQSNGNESVGTTLPAEAKVEDESKTPQTPSIASRRRIIQMLEKKEKLLEKDVMKKIKQLNKQNKILATEQQTKKPDAKQVDQKESKPIVAKTQPTPVDAKKKTMPRVAVAKASSTVKQKATEPAKIPKTVVKSKQPAKADVSSALKQLAAAPADAPPPKVIGNTEYFILTGTDAQLSAQLSSLAANNVRIENCLELDPSVADKIEQQLEQLSQNREQILQRMREKQNMLAKRRTKRSKEPSKYT
ncbi:PREDICTED: neurofilament heavy polypeptide [Drosophila arizonae]|uniref:Neurofilament heavy polypeptide n=1 Tax=Drosophila arizonae TaxID=7263 RepID=A0ABM1Q4K4_DROAR|nr:PREDICTED: neurofilament heavy polypeptide [Drosophila arizonae]